MSHLAFRERVAAFLRQHPNEWIPAIRFEEVGGRQAWRTRLAECRTVYGMDIENRCRLADLFDAEPTLEDEYSRLTLEERGWKVLRDQTLLALIHDVQALTRYVERKRRMVKAALVQTENERKDTA